jgi:hypothetical protein
VRKLTPEQKVKAKLLTAINDLRAAAFAAGDDHTDVSAAVSLDICEREIDKLLKAYMTAVVKRAKAGCA